MATIDTPKINKILRVTEFDILRIAITAGNMYICTDSLKMYYDENAVTRSIYAYQGIKTVNDLMYNVTPNKGTSYYCWEDNSLWIWMDKWITLWSDSNYPSAYIYEDYPSVSNPQSLNGIYTEVLDNNGLLGDGSVVIRDTNRIIKGKIYVNDDNDNLMISSFLGGGIRFLPNGKMSTDGELLIGDEGASFLRSEWNVLNNDMYVDFSEKPQDDTALPELKTQSHRYKVFHEGNLDASLIKDITGEEIYNKLIKDDNVPNPMQFNVTSINGKTDTDFAPVKHEHLSSDITDFTSETRKQADVEIKTVMNSLAGEGVTVIPESTTSTYKLNANSFRLSFKGGVTGSSTVSHLTDTTVNLTVDPTQHEHSDYKLKLTDLQNQINEIDAMNKDDYYVKSQVDNMINEVKGTETPIEGKPVLVNENGILDVEVSQADKFSSIKTVNFIGDIQGNLSTDFSETTDVRLDASNIISVVPVEGKALLVDSNGNLPGNCETSSALDHNIELSLTGEASGTVSINTHKDTNSNKTTVKLETTLKPGSNILQTKDLGDTVASLDSNNQVPAEQIPVGVNGSLCYSGTFNPNSGVYPSVSPIENQYWVASEDGSLGDETYNENDWIVYQNGVWTPIHFSSAVQSVNGKSGAVTLTAFEVGAISDTYLDYEQSGLIPAGKVVVTTDEGIISGAAVLSLVNSFKTISSASSEIVIDDNNQNQTNGTSDITLTMRVSDALKTELDEKYASVFVYDSKELDHTRLINLSDKFNVSQIDGNTYLDLNIESKTSGITKLIGDGQSKTITLTHNLNTTNIIVQFREVDTGSQILMDNRIVDANTIEITSNEIIETDSIRVYIGVI